MCSVCRLASQSQLLTVCFTPPTSTLPAPSNVSSTPCVKTPRWRVPSAALDNSGRTRFLHQDLLCAQTGPAVQVADRLDRQLGVRSQTDGGITWVRHAGGRPTQYPPSGKALASAVRQSSFFPGLQFHEWWNLLSGENSFFGLWEILQWQAPSTALGWGPRAVRLRAPSEPGFCCSLGCVAWGKLLNFSKPPLFLLQIVSAT